MMFKEPEKLSCSTDVHDIKKHGDDESIPSKQRHRYVKQMACNYGHVLKPKHISLREKQYSLKELLKNGWANRTNKTDEQD